MGPREEGVEVVSALQDLRRPCHVPVGGQPGVGLQHSQGLADGVHLWAERGVSTGGDRVEPELTLETVTANPLDTTGCYEALCQALQQQATQP